MPAFPNKLASAAAALLTAAVPASAADDGAFLFPEGTALLTAEAKYAAGLDADTDAASLVFGLDYFVTDNLSLGLELAGAAFVQDEDAAAVMLGARLRHHVLAWDDASLFLGVGIGPAYAGEPTPAGGTRFNFLSHAGVGTAVRLRDGLFFTAEVDFWHLSNGNLVADSDNPTVNGLRGGVGLAWRL